MENLIPMFLAAGKPGAYTAPEILFAVLAGGAPVVVTLWVKWILFRRLRAEDTDRPLPLPQTREVHSRQKGSRSRSPSTLRPSLLLPAARHRAGRGRASLHR